MFPRFISVLFDPSARDDKSLARPIADRLARKSGWTRRFDSAGMIAFDNGPARSAHIHLLPHDGGVVYGALFASPGARPVADTLLQHAHAAPDRRAKALIGACWGRYIALLDDRTTFPALLRDPSGRSPCYVLRLAGSVRLAFSDIEDVLPIVREHLKIDWTYVRRFLTEHVGSTRATAIRNVSELLPGESFTVTGGDDRYSAVWDPVALAKDRIDDFEQASELVRGVGQFCADRWAEQFGRAVLSLSGGLDSSVLAGLLARAPGTQKVLCRNLYSDLVEADERHFAQLVAAKHGLELVTGKHGVVAMDFGSVLECGPITLNPNRAFATISAVKERQAFLDRIEADSFWSGFGGDQVFAADRNVAMARDYVVDRLAPIKLLQVARDASEITGTSIAKVLRNALRRDGHAAPNFRLPPASFYAADLAQSPIDRALPFAAACANLPPAKAAHVMSVVMSLASNPFEKLADRPVIEFYASQPLIEACLRIPTYVHNQGGLRRSLQRHAFADLLPDEVRLRRGKSSSASDIVESMLSPRNTRFIRQRIEHGVLLERGLLEPSRTKSVVAFDRVPAPSDVNALINCIAVEDWAAKWKNALAA